MTCVHDSVDGVDGERATERACMMGEAGKRFVLVTVLTCLRLVAAPALMVMPFGMPVFWLVYLGCGVSDMVDGFLARRWNVSSEFGAKLDTAADLVFLLCAGLALWPHLSFPPVYLSGATVVLVIRLVSIGVIWARFGVFAILHTWGNKASGLVLFALPLLNHPWYWSVCVAVCALASVEELALAATQPTLRRDVRSLLHSVGQ